MRFDLKVSAWKRGHVKSCRTAFSQKPSAADLAGMPTLAAARTLAALARPSGTGGGGGGGGGHRNERGVMHGKVSV